MASYPVRAVRVDAFVPAPPEKVFAFVADTRNDPRWCSNVDTAELMSKDEVAVGTRFRFHQHLERPRRPRLEFDVDVEVVGLDDRSITWHTTDKFQKRVISLTVEPASGGARVTQVTNASFRKPPGVAKWVYPILARRTLQRQFVDLAAVFATHG